MIKLNLTANNPAEQQVKDYLDSLLEEDLTELIDQNIQTSIDNLDTKVTANTNAINKNATDITTNKNNISKNTNEIDTLKNRVSNAETDIDNLEKDLQTLRGESSQSLATLDESLSGKINKIVVKLNAPLNWGDLKNGLNITL